MMRAHDDTPDDDGRAPFAGDIFARDLPQSF